MAAASQTCDLFQSHCSETLVTLTCFAWQFKDGQWKVSCRGHVVEKHQTARLIVSKLQAATGESFEACQQLATVRTRRFYEQGNLAASRKTHDICLCRKSLFTCRI